MIPRKTSAFPQCSSYIRNSGSSDFRMSAKKNYPMENTYVSSMFPPTCVILVAQIAGCLPKKDPLQNTSVSSMFLPSSVIRQIRTSGCIYAKKNIPCRTCTFPQCFPSVHDSGSSDFRMSPKKGSHARHAPSLNVPPTSVVRVAQISGCPQRLSHARHAHLLNGFPTSVNRVLRFQDVSHKIIPCKTCTFPQCSSYVRNSGNTDFRMSPEKLSHARHARFLNVSPNYVRISGTTDFSMSPKKLSHARHARFLNVPPNYVRNLGLPKKLSHARHARFLNVPPNYVRNSCSSDFRMSPKKLSHARHARFLNVPPNYVRISSSSDFRMSPEKTAHARHARSLNVSPTSIIWVAQIPGCLTKKNPMHNMHICSMFPLRPFFGLPRFQDVSQKIDPMQDMHVSSMFSLSP